MVGNTLRLMLTRGLSMIRWNNFPRVIDIKQMDNVGMTLHTALFLSYHEESEIDTLYLMKKIIFTSFADLILSDINSGTKNYIKKLDKKIFDELYAKAYDYFLQIDAPVYLKQDFQNTLTRTDKLKEDHIFLAAKKYVGLFEAQMNARIFPEMYELPLQQMHMEIQDVSQQLDSLKNLLENTNHEKYLAHIYRLSFSMRWNQYKRNTPISVMSHKVIVTYISYIIWMTWNHAGEQNDITDMMMRAIYHDVPEVITGDIITPTKKAVPGFVALLEKVEKTMMDDYLFGYISPQYKEYIAPYILSPFHGEAWKLVKYADIFSALIEAKIEDRQGNIFFHETYQTILAHVANLSHPWGELLLREILFFFDNEQDDNIAHT